jgi:putative ABC transport system permease protein
MFTHYLRIAFRGFRGNKLHSLISTGCLAIGIATAMTILLYVLHEHSYDRWQRDANRIFAVSTTIKAGNSVWTIDRVSYAAAPMIRQADARVESYVRAFSPSQNPVLRSAGTPDFLFGVDKPFLFADSNFFRFFSYRLLEGDPDLVLVRPNTVVLTRSVARKYFGDSDPVGKTLLYNGEQPLEVTGVCADPPSNTTLDFDCIASGISLKSMGEMKPMLPSMQSQLMQGGAFQTWIKLRSAASAGQVTATIDRLAAQSRDSKDGDPDQFYLTALPDIHLHNNFGDSSNTRYLTIFPLVAGLILLLALINYMSLATARAIVRAREVGVRKVLGAGRGRLAGQFYVESAVMALLSFAGGLLLFILFRPVFFNLIQLRIDAGFLLTTPMLASFGCLLLLVILASGSYPSLVLSAFRPVAVLYGKLSRRRSGERMRKGFLVFQFSISMALILCSLIIEKEMYFIRHADTGVDRENVVMIPFGTHLAHYHAYKHDVEALPGVELAATANHPMYKGHDAYFIDRGGETMMLPIMTVDENFLRLLGMKWKQKAADQGLLYDGGHVVINETAVGKLGLKNDPVGQTLKVDKDYIVAGVIQDFNFQSLQAPVSPLCLFMERDTAAAWGRAYGGCLFVKVRPHVNLPELLAKAKKIYAGYDRQTPFAYEFLDEAFDAQYKAEDRLAGLMGIFTAITIVIACLGLFALATFAAQQRLKEIGIRKVLGASVASIGVLLSRDFLRPVLFSVVIASPVAWWVMHGWLQNFASRTVISWWIFPAAGGGLLLIAQLTVLFRTIRAARVNPTINLRNE